MKKISKFIAVILALSMLLTAAPVAFAGSDINYKIENPYKTIDFATVNQYKADLHSHTTFSDGHDSLPAMTERHYELGFDIYARTDHSTVSYGYMKHDYVPAMKVLGLIKNGVSVDNNKMEIENNVVEQTAPVVNPLDELGAAVEEFKLKIKAMFEESTALSRKVKEVALIQKQKERDFIQARRAIERIRMAI